MNIKYEYGLLFIDIGITAHPTDKFITMYGIGGEENLRLIK